MHRLVVVFVFFLASMLAPLRSRAETAAEPLLGVYGENSMQRVLDFEKWLGRPVDQILCTVDFYQWGNYRYADWLSQTVYGARGARRLVYDVPIIINGANYLDAEAGAYDDHWRCLAQSILANNPGTYEIVIRPSHEMNGDWFAWGVGGSRQVLIPDFIASWRRFHGIFRGVAGGERYRFSFSVSEGASDPRPMWPGDSYVDLVGYDAYWKPKAMGGEGWETVDAKTGWALRLNNGYNEWGIGGMLAFARSKGKPFQIDEWGVWGPDAAPFVEGMAAFLRTNGIRAHTYWNSNAAYPGELHTRELEWPLTTVAFKAAFGPPGRILVNETFADGNRSGQSATPPLTSLDWHLGPSAANTVAGNVWSVTPAANTILLAHFPPVTLEVGQALKVSFNYRHALAPTTTPFRIGLFNSNGATLGGDFSSVSPDPFSAYTGYVVFTALGTATGTGSYAPEKNATTSPNVFGLAENTSLAGSGIAPGNTAAGTLYEGSITLSSVSSTSMTVTSSFNGRAVSGTDTSPVITVDTLAIFITQASGTFDLSNVALTLTTPAPKVVRVDSRGGADFTALSQAVAAGLKPGDTLQLVPGGGPYRETLYIPASGTFYSPIIFDGAGETVTGFDVLGGFQTVGGVTTCDLTPYWTTNTGVQGFSKINGRWAALSVPSTAAQPVPFVLTYKGERVVQSATVRTTPPAGSPAGTLGKLGQLTRYATLSDDGNTLSLLPGVSAGDWEISVRNFAVRIYNASHQVYRNLRATGSLNDGFNLHGVGTDLVFENIEGSNNLDEGFSAHDTISSTIERGLFCRNDNGLFNVNSSLLGANDIACFDNVGIGIGFSNTAVAKIENLRVVRSGVRGLSLQNQAALTLAGGSIHGGGWSQKPFLSCNESGAVSAYQASLIDTAAGALLAGDAPAVFAATPPVDVGLDSLGQNLQVVFVSSDGSDFQLEDSTDLESWAPLGPVFSDAITHQYYQPLSPSFRHFYRLVQ